MVDPTADHVLMDRPGDEESYGVRTIILGKEWWL